MKKYTQELHGGSYTKLYRTYVGIKERCYNPKKDNYKYYGGRGIVVCKEWLDSFEAFKNWALTNGYEKHLTIDRKKSDENYTPQNCRWTTPAVQAINRRKSPRTTKTPGVRTEKSGKFSAYISINNKTTFIGIFNTTEEASKSFEEARKKRNEKYIKQLG